MIPSVGRIVHVRDRRGSGRCLAAIITDVRELVGNGAWSRYAVGLTVFPPAGSITEPARRIAPATDPRAWHDPRECPGEVPAT